METSRTKSPGPAQDQSSREGDNAERNSAQRAIDRVGDVPPPGERVDDEATNGKVTRRQE